MSPTYKKSIEEKGEIDTLGHTLGTGETRGRGDGVMI
jgi:hypothetical protein